MFASTLASRCGPLCSHSNASDSCTTGSSDGNSTTDNNNTGNNNIAIYYITTSSVYRWLTFLLSTLYLTSPIRTCCSHTHDVTYLLQVSLTLKQVRLDQPELSWTVQLPQHLQYLTQEEAKTAEKVAPLKLNGHAKLQGRS